MAYDEHLADRIRHTFHSLHASFEEKKMMGGLCFMVNDKYVRRRRQRQPHGAYRPGVLRPGSRPRRLSRDGLYRSTDARLRLRLTGSDR